ncbi:Flagellar hook-length control protein FliK [Actinosynnema pretiosum subsp. pretiosum]|nr:Flagellar hook-length control protein FliK [Actinosynnema pretiosum subsp. pretiosum]
MAPLPVATPSPGASRPAPASQRPDTRGSQVAPDGLVVDPDLKAQLDAAVEANAKGHPGPDLTAQRPDFPQTRSDAWNNFKQAEHNVVQAKAELDAAQQRHDVAGPSSAPKDLADAQAKFDAAKSDFDASVQDVRAWGNDPATLLDTQADLREQSLKDNPRLLGGTRDPQAPQLIRDLLAPTTPVPPTVTPATATAPPAPPSADTTTTAPPAPPSPDTTTTPAQPDASVTPPPSTQVDQGPALPDFDPAPPSPRAPSPDLARAQENYDGARSDLDQATQARYEAITSNAPPSTIAGIDAEIASIHSDIQQAAADVDAVLRAESPSDARFQQWHEQAFGADTPVPDTARPDSPAPATATPDPAVQDPAVQDPASPDAKSDADADADAAPDVDVPPARQPQNLESVLPRDQWWRLFLDPRDHNDAQAQQPHDPGNLYDTQSSPGFKQSMETAYEQVLNPPDMSAQRLTSADYKRMHELATANLKQQFDWSGQLGPQGNAIPTEFPLRNDTVAADVLSDSINGRPLMIDMQAHFANPSTGPVQDPLTILNRHSYDNPAISTNYRFDEAPGLIDAVLTRYYENTANAKTDHEKLREIARVVRTSHIIHPFQDGNRRLNVHLLLPRLLLEQGFKPVILPEMPQLFQGGFDLDQIATALAGGQDKDLTANVFPPPQAQPSQAELDAQAKVDAAIEANLQAQIDGPVSPEVQAQLNRDIENAFADLGDARGLPPVPPSQAEVDAQAKVDAAIEANLQAQIDGPVSPEVQAQLNRDIENAFADLGDARGLPPAPLSQPEVDAIAQLDAAIEANLDAHLEGPVSPDRQAQLNNDIESAFANLNDARTIAPPTTSAPASPQQRYDNAVGQVDTAIEANHRAQMNGPVSPDTQAQLNRDIESAFAELNTARDNLTPAPPAVDAPPARDTGTPPPRRETGTRTPARAATAAATTSARRPEAVAATGARPRRRPPTRPRDPTRTRRATPAPPGTAARRRPTARRRAAAGRARPRRTPRRPPRRPRTRR